MHDVSVVLACYNGEKEVENLLDSLFTQSRRPDEVLILDDCSTDGTADVTQKYIRDHQINGWSVTENRQNLGWKRNFMQGMNQAKGELVFLCDQDDIWDPEKIKKMEEIMSQHPRIDLLACDYDVQYETGSIPMKRYKKKRQEKTGETAQYQFTSRFFQNPAPGCTYAIRRSFLERVAEYWFPEAPHDEFLWLMAAMEDKAWFLNRKLMTIRRGAANASDIKYKDIELQQKQLRYIAAMLEKMEQYAKCHPEAVTPEKNEYLKNAKIWCKKRQNLMEKRNPFLWIGMFPYWKNYNSFRNCLSDLYLILFGSFSR